MEDLFVDEEYLHSINCKEDVKTALNELAVVIKNSRHNDFMLLCCIRNIVYNSTFGQSILAGGVNYLKIASIGKENTVKVLNKMFGFSLKHIEYLVKIINKFLRSKNTSDVGQDIQQVLKSANESSRYGLTWEFDFCEYLGISKLQELLPLSKEQIQYAFDSKVLTVRSTVKEIREYVRSIKNGGKVDNKVLEEQRTEEINEEDIPEVYHPNKFYSKQYFKSLDKDDLVLAIWALQRLHYKNDKKFQKFLDLNGCIEDMEIIKEEEE